MIKELLPKKICAGLEFINKFNISKGNRKSVKGHEDQWNKVVGGILFSFSSFFLSVLLCKYLKVIPKISVWLQLMIILIIKLSISVWVDWIDCMLNKTSWKLWKMLITVSENPRWCPHVACSVRPIQQKRQLWLSYLNSTWLKWLIKYQNC